MLNFIRKLVNFLNFYKFRFNNSVNFHFELLQKAKNPKNLKHTLNLWILWLSPQYDKAMAQHDNKTRRYDKLGTCLNLSKAVWQGKVRHREQKRALANFACLKHNVVVFTNKIQFYTILIIFCLIQCFLRKI